MLVCTSLTHQSHKLFCWSSMDYAATQMYLSWNHIMYFCKISFSILLDSRSESLQSRFFWTWLYFSMGSKNSLLSTTLKFSLASEENCLFSGTTALFTIFLDEREFNKNSYMPVCKRCYTPVCVLLEMMGRLNLFIKYLCYKAHGIYRFFILLCIISHSVTSRLKWTVAPKLKSN